MARLPRLAAAGFPHHVIQRGNDRQTVFREDADYARYLGWLREIAAAHGLLVHAYVLMPNHVHLLATPPTGDALSRVVQSLGRRYVRWFNDKYARSGTLWEGRFRSTVIDADRYLLACSRYIELNPVRAGIVDSPELYRWSSYAHHAGVLVDPLVTDHPLVWALGNTPFERQLAYRRLFDLELTPELLLLLRSATNRGRPLGAFATGSQAASQPRPRGRPRKPDPA
ncbi:MAG: transposase, partial [Pseudomonadota bacterium]